MIGDFCRWNNRLVFGCDDAAKSEFLNRRKAKGELPGPGQSQSNLWFATPSLLDELGPAIGRGAVWINEAVKAGEWSDPFLFAGFERRGAHIATGTIQPVVFEIQVDALGDGQWRKLRDVTVRRYAWLEFSAAEQGDWVRVRTNEDCARQRCSSCAAMRIGARAGRSDLRGIGSILGWASPRRARLGAGDNQHTLNVAAATLDGSTLSAGASYELDGSMRLTRLEDPTTHDRVIEQMAIPQGVIRVDAASAIYVDEAGRRWRLPRGDATFDELSGRGLLRIDREVVTERDLFHCHGTFYELPAENAGGFARIRPISTHNRRITDYGSYRGLLVMTGVCGGESNRHIIRSRTPERLSGWAPWMIFGNWARPWGAAGRGRTRL